jgi:PAS domain S-box-containing protein
MDSSDRSGGDRHAPRASAGAAGSSQAPPLEAWLDLVLETSPVAMGIISALDSRYVRVNRAMAELVGMSVAEILSCDPYRLALQTTHPDDLVAEQKLFAELAVGARRSYRIEKRFVRADGTTRWGCLTFSGIHGPALESSGPGGPGEPVRPIQFAISQVVDITETKALRMAVQHREEELRHAQKIDGIGRLTAGIAHDFNNLITVIMGHGEVLKDLVRHRRRTPSIPELQESLDEILAACDRAASLTAQVLTHGRREPVAASAFVLSPAVEGWTRFLARALGTHVQMHVDLHEALTAEGAIFADQDQVGQIVMNLVLNARDAIGEGGRISVTTRDLVVEADGVRRGAPGPGEWVVLAISDDGHGMSPEVRARIFEPFFTTRTDRAGRRGTGLGMATVQRIVTEAGGCIDVESAPGAGTTVSVYFPRVAPVPAGGTPVEAPPRAVVPAPNTRRVLVVEDEPAVRSLVANVLLGAHHRVEVARDGEEAWRLVEPAPGQSEIPFHLIVSDLAMPNAGGISLARRLRERGIACRMLFISGFGDHASAEVAAFGPLLPKPFTPAQLLDAVRDAIDGAGVTSGPERTHP